MGREKMNHRHEFGRFIAAALPVAAFAVSTQPAVAETVRIVPYGMELVEGSREGDISDVGSFRQQQLYLASEFEKLPTTHHTIVGLAARPDASFRQSSSASYDDITVRAAVITENALGENFVLNQGAGAATVFSGPLTISTAGAGPVGGPLEFDVYYPFQTPFIYDPDAGNLLVEISSASGLDGRMILDVFNGEPNTYLAAFPAGSSTGNLQAGGFVNQLEFAETLLADFNLDLSVDDQDLAVWEGGFGSPGSREDGDANGDGLVTGADFLVWQREYVAGVPGLAAELGVPEPATCALLLAALAAMAGPLAIGRRR